MAVTNNDFSTSGFLKNDDGMSVGIKESRLAGCEWSERIRSRM
jgi:hypothetical protein